MNTQSKQSLPNKGEDSRIQSLYKGLEGCSPISKKLEERLLNRIKKNTIDKCTREYAKHLYSILYVKSKSRRMAATEIGFPDQTYMVTQYIIDWIKDGTAQVTGMIRCERSLRYVQGVTTNPKLFKNVDSNQLKMPF